jgi:hypothetical protein
LILNWPGHGASKGWTLGRQGKYAEAAKAYYKAIRIDLKTDMPGTTVKSVP